MRSVQHLRTILVGVSAIVAKSPDFLSTRMTRSQALIRGVAATESPISHPSKLQKTLLGGLAGLALAGGGARAAKANAEPNASQHPPTQEARVEQSQKITYPAGWNLIGVTPGTDLSQAVNGSLLTFQAGDTNYESVDPANAQPGLGYWAYFPTNSQVTLQESSGNSFKVRLPSSQFIQVGNPTTNKVDVAGADAVFPFDTRANSYKTTTQLAPGQGAWAFSAAGADATITTVDQTPPVDQAPSPEMRALQDQYTWTPESKDNNGNLLSPSDFLRTAGKLYIPEGQWQNIFQVTDNATAEQMQIAAANQQKYQILFPVIAQDLGKIAWIERRLLENRSDGEILGQDFNSSPQSACNPKPQQWNGFNQILLQCPRHHYSMAHGTIIRHGISAF